MRIQVSYRTASESNYERFCLENPNINITFNQWKEILYKFSENISEYILQTGEKVKLPYGLGDISINKKKPKRFKEFQGKEYSNMAIDWKKTKEVGKYVYHMNLHTEGYRFSWMWFKNNCRFYQHQLWWFKPCRKISRKINTYLLKSDQYIQLYNQWKIN